MSTATIHHGVATPMRDGTTLRADIWRPGGTGPWPAILIRTPYGRSFFNADSLRPEHCVRGGYACVVQDVRGRGNSGGDWVPFQWAQEALDTYDSVEWVAAQPWCDSSVGMAGASYLGIVQWLGAAAWPLYLRAIAPAMHSSGELDRVDVAVVDETARHLDRLRVGPADRGDHAVKPLGRSAGAPMKGLVIKDGAGGPAQSWRFRTRRRRHVGNPPIRVLFQCRWGSGCVA